MPEKFDQIDHVAIEVRDIASAVQWYTSTFKCQIDYQDDTWAFLKFNNIKLALVIPEQHPAHVAFVTGRAENFGQLKTHRDGTRSVYINDPAGNPIEVMAPDHADQTGHHGDD